MDNLTIEHHKYQLSFHNETWIIDKRKQTEFQITLKQGCDIEIDFNWYYGYGGRGHESTTISVELKELIND